MSDITDFLLARIAEDRGIALASVNWSEGVADWSDAGDPGWEHIARHDPARVLRECKAKRQIVEECANYEDIISEDVLRHLASVYADHPDYRPEWAI